MPPFFLRPLQDFKLKRRRLAIRFSSLGDVVLSTTFLSSLDELPVESFNRTKNSCAVVDQDDQVDWLTLECYAPLIASHPRVRHCWSYRREDGLLGLKHLARLLYDENYAIIYDLHSSLRSRLIRILFLIWNVQAFFNRLPRSDRQWQSIPKQRIRLWCLFLFKHACPRSFRPQPWIERYARMASTQKVPAYPNLCHLLLPSEAPHLRPPSYHSRDAGDLSGLSWYRPSAYPSIQEILTPGKARLPLLCVMPSARWATKQWPVKHYLRLLKELNGLYLPVILGEARDAASLELCQSLVELSVLHGSAVGQLSLEGNARLLAQSVALVGGDTGLAHLAQALGVPAYVIFGPTIPDLGFGPWGRGSHAFYQRLWCQPCGKDGRRCYRLTQPYHCLNSQKPDAVIAMLRARLTAPSRVASSNSRE